MGPGAWAWQSRRAAISKLLGGKNMASMELCKAAQGGARDRWALLSSQLLLLGGDLLAAISVQDL